MGRAFHHRPGQLFQVRLQPSGRSAQFGAPIILTPFNYQSGRQYGAEFTTNLNFTDFNAYLNASCERAAGRNITSSQFEFDPGDLAYIADNYIPLDHQQIVSLSGGASYNGGHRHHPLDQFPLWLGALGA